MAGGPEVYAGSASERAASGVLWGARMISIPVGFDVFLFPRLGVKVLSVDADVDGYLPSALALDGPEKEFGPRQRSKEL
jgi:hypothetical protein